MQMHIFFNRILLTTVLAVVLLTLVTGCTCGEFFRDSSDVVGVSISPTNTSIQPGTYPAILSHGNFPKRRHRRRDRANKMDLVQPVCGYHRCERSCHWSCLWNNHHIRELPVLRGEH